MENSIKISEFNESFKPVLFSPKNEEDKNELKKLLATGKIMFFDSFDLQLAELIKSQNPSRKLSQEETEEKNKNFIIIPDCQLLKMGYGFITLGEIRWFGF